MLRRGTHQQTQRVCVSLFRNCLTVFQAGCTLCVPTRSGWDFRWLRVLTCVWCFQDFLGAILVGVLWLMGLGICRGAVYHPSISFSDIYVPVFCLVFDWIISYVVVQRSFIEYVICKYFSLSLWLVLFPLFTLFKEVRSV